MKERYIKTVKHALQCGRKQKREVLRDLEEIFSSAAEHGQSENETIARLGAPQEYAAAMDESLGLDRKAVLRRRAFFSILPPAVLALILWVCYRIARPLSFHEQMSVGIIGGADGPTSILIATSPASPYTAPVLLVLCILCALAAICGLIRYLLNRKK